MLGSRDLLLVRRGGRGLAAAGPLDGPAGERNSLRLKGRGTFVCISPWNFPLAIFTGQVAAALAAGPAPVSCFESSMAKALFLDRDGTEGIEIIRRMKADEQVKGLPVIGSHLRART